MVTLLLLELRDSNFYNNYRQSTTATHSPCLEYLLSENLLVKLYDWSIHTGRYKILMEMSVNIHIVLIIIFYYETYNVIDLIMLYVWNN